MAFTKNFKMDFLPEKINDYVEKHSQAEPELLAKLNRETWQKQMQPRMLSGHLQGSVLSMLSKLIQPKIFLKLELIQVIPLCVWLKECRKMVNFIR